MGWPSPFSPARLASAPPGRSAIFGSERGGGGVRRAHQTRNRQQRIHASKPGRWIPGERRKVAPPRGPRPSVGERAEMMGSGRAASVATPNAEDEPQRRQWERRRARSRCSDRWRRALWRDTASRERTPQCAGQRGARWRRRQSRHPIASPPGPRGSGAIGSGGDGNGMTARRRN